MAVSAMAAGCAVITSDTAPQRRMLGNGVVFVKPGDPQALATAIEALTSNPDYLTQKQRDARVAAERFTSGEITRDLTQWIIDSKQSRK